jgi:hypothetical protein
MRHDFTVGFCEDVQETFGIIVSHIRVAKTIPSYCF